MTKTSNIYADRIFAEHPISLYTLDDDIGYLSLINNDQRLFLSGGWSSSANNSASVILNDSPDIPSLASPFSSNIYSSFAASGIVSDNTSISIISPTLFNSSDLNEELKTFSLSFFLYQSSIKINWYEVGYIYYDLITLEDVEVVNRIEAEEGTGWINFDFSYSPNLETQSNIRIVIKANVDSGGSETDYTFVVNGISLGQWSEIYSSESLGAFPQSSSVVSSSVEIFGVPANRYGTNKGDGYYVVENNRLLAKNSGLPLVYGSKNSLRLYPSTLNMPSLIIPGEGFLHDSGKYNEYSIEFWMKIKPNTTESRKIFGPIDSNDGLYVNRDVISLVFENEIGSYNVSEWYRPMLVHILLKNDSVLLFINGEQVLNILFNVDTFDFSKENDWVAFYSYEDILNFEISCISFYSYLISLEVAKKRFVYGQGTESPQNLADSFNGNNVFINFSNANFTTNRTYPDTNRWQSGYSDNLSSNRFSISSPQYSLPQIFIENRELSDLYQDNKIACEAEDDLFFSFRPKSQSEINLIPDFFIISESGGWSKINNTSLQNLFLQDLQYEGIRIASFNQWKRVLSDQTQTFDWDNWSDDDWSNVYFFESNGFIAGSKYSSRIPVIPNVFYKFSIDVKRILGNANNPKLRIEWFNAETGGSQVGDSIFSEDVDLNINQWSSLFVQELAPIGATHAEISILLSDEIVNAGEVQLFANPKFISPDLNWSEPGYIFFDNLQQIENLSSFYGVFSTNNLIDYSPIMSITNSTSLDKLDIFIEQNFLKYKFNENLLYEEILDENILKETENSLTSYGPSVSEFSFLVGINIPNFSKSFKYQVLQFFSSVNNLQIYVGGNEQKTFTGKIYSIGFCNKNNTAEIQNSFLTNGIVDKFEYEDLSNHFATYTLVPIIKYNKFFLDIGISSVWEEYFPLTSFAGFVKNIQGNKYYDLDYLQLNLGYPAITEKKDDEIDISKSSIISSFTFQPLNKGANQPLKNFPYTKKITDSYVIDAQKENTFQNPFKAYSTRFEFVDHAIVFPPKNIDFRRIAIVFHFEIKHKGILSNPIKVRNFEIASKSLNQFFFNPIGTESGIPIYPYVQTGIYFNNKEKNPILVSKKRLPYLNLNQTSGIKVIKNNTQTQTFGIAIPINQERAAHYSIGALQFWIKYDNDSFSSTPVPIFEIQNAEKTIEFVIVSDFSEKRGMVFPRNKLTKQIENNIILYQNGTRVKNLIFEKNFWESVGIEIKETLAFDNIVGYLNIFSGATFNNISYFSITGLAETSGILSRKWLRVLTEDDISNFDWEYWYDENQNAEIKQWRDVYVLEETESFLITPKEIYSSYVGTNRIIVDDETSILFDIENVLLYSSSVKTINNTIFQDLAISWLRFTDTPA
jgi:hypothetical protein